MITIEKIVFFGNVEYDEDFNAKVVYEKYKKIYVCCFFVDFFHRKIYIPKQPKFHKVLVGLEEKLQKHYFN